MESGNLASSPLLTAALAGLMGASLSACSKEKKETVYVPTEKVGEVISTTKDETVTLASFKVTCDARGGLVQTHASCAGSNTCAGVSFNEGTLTEHTCKAMNGCAGMSCVDLAEGSNLSGEAILVGSIGGDMVGSETQCNFCHGDGKDKFILKVAPTAVVADAVTAFQNKPDSALVSAIAFGLHGVKSDGQAYSNMPGFYQAYSLAEIKGLVAHIRTLPVEGKAWTDPQ